MGLILLLLGLAVVLSLLQGVVLIFMWRETQAVAAQPVDAVPRVPPSRFFATAAPASSVAAVPAALLLAHLEQHIRAEQAAAESYHWSPTVDALHRHTSSPLLH